MLLNAETKTRGGGMLAVHKTTPARHAKFPYWTTQTSIVRIRRHERNYPACGEYISHKVLCARGKRKSSQKKKKKKKWVESGEEGWIFQMRRGKKKSPCVRLKAGSQVVLVPKREAIEV